ncbi:MAG: YqgE/AlgH family protein [Bacteroidales bacterium]|nr:YqgE/AlgH family protein [Bacteroidales bacterium]
MNKVPNIFSIKHNIEPSVGKFLISEPLLNDGIFGRSVVLLTEHNEEGTIGYVLNKASGFIISQLLPMFKGFSTPVYIGGPVATNTVHFIYRSSYPIKNSKSINNELFWGGDIKELLTLMKNNKINESNVRFFVGYSGWSKNQLNQELQKGYWLVSHFPISHIFEEDPSMLWKRSVIQLDRKYHFWLNVPINPSLN